MRVLITGTARAQYLDMVQRYLQTTPQRPPRPHAARKLIETYDAALAHIASEPRAWLTHPRPYPDLTRYGFRWVRLHRYWFGYDPGPPAIITNIFYEAANIPARVSQDTEPTDPA